MENTNKTSSIPRKKYAVVEFLNTTNKLYKGVCVPSSWIKSYENENNPLRVYYPVEDAAITARRVSKYTKASPLWKIHPCKLLCTTNVYAEAKYKADEIINKLVYQKKFCRTGTAEHAIPPGRRRTSPNSSTRKSQPKDASFEKAQRIETADLVSNPSGSSPRDSPKEPVNTTEPQYLLLQIKGVLPSTGFDANLLRTISLGSVYLNTDSIGCVPVKDNENIKVNISRPTLKYQGPGSELKELMPGSNVYANRVLLNKNADSARDIKELISLILPLIFTRDALCNCKLAGSKKPLDKNAVDCFLIYLKQHVKSKNWEKTNMEVLKWHIRYELQKWRKANLPDSKMRAAGYRNNAGKRCF